MEAANNDPKAGLKDAEANPNVSGNGNGHDLNGNGNGHNGNGKRRRKFLKLIAALGGAAIIAKIWPSLAEAQTQSHPPSQINQTGASTGQVLKWDGSAWAAGSIASRTVLGADSNTVTVTGITATQVKDIDFIKDSSTLSVTTLTIAARIKSSNALYTTTLRVRADGAGTDSLTLTTTSTSLTVVTGTISASGYAAGRHTLEFFLDSSNASGVATMDMTEVWGE